MSEDKVIYGKPDCKHKESTTPIINLPGMERCDGCGEVVRPKLTRYECLRSLTLEELSEDLVGDITEFLLELIGHPHPVGVCKAWLMEEVDE